MENIDKIESAAIEIQGENVIITTPITITKDEYISQLQARISSLNENKMNVQGQLSSIDQALSDAQDKLNQL